MSRTRSIVVVIVLLPAVCAQRTVAQSAATSRARLEVAAEFLKAGDVELATKTLIQLTDVEPANWQARGLLALAYLAANETAKVETELQRLRTLKAPATAIEAVERQFAATKRASALRDELTALLHIGKTQEALSRIDSADLPASGKQLLRAYVATVRGQFDEATQLLGGEFADFKEKIKGRADEYTVARDKALVAWNFLGNRYCGQDTGEMFWCKDWRSLTKTQQQAWDEIRLGNGKVPPMFAAARRSGGLADRMTNAGAALDARRGPALGMLARFVALAPLHPDALHAATVLALHSGSREDLRTAAERSVNASGAWLLRTRRCSHSRTMNSAMFWHACSVGEEQQSKELRAEGGLALDARSRTLRFHVVQPSAWQTAFAPALGPARFELPFDQVKAVRSRPGAGMKDGTGPWIDEDAVMFDFGQDKTVQMYLDFTFQLKAGSGTALMVKAIEDVLAVFKELVPAVAVDFKAEFKEGSFTDSLNRAVGVASVLAGSVGIANASQTGQQILADQQQTDAANARGASAAWQTIVDLKVKDGRSMIDTALENVAFKQDIQTLLELATP